MSLWPDAADQGGNAPAVQNGRTAAQTSVSFPDAVFRMVATSHQLLTANSAASRIPRGSDSKRGIFTMAKFLCPGGVLLGTAACGDTSGPSAPSRSGHRASGSGA